MKILSALATGLSLVLLPALVAAQDFPNRPIRLIVPFPAGSPNDIIARVIGQRMSEIIKQPVLIDNRGGQGGVLGTDAVAKAAPDGYTIAISSAGALAISPSMALSARNSAMSAKARNMSGCWTRSTAQNPSSRAFRCGAR